MALNTALTAAARPRAVPVGRGRLERRIDRDETAEVLFDIRRYAGHIHLAVVAERPDLALHAAGQVISLAERRLRQITGGDDR